MKKKATSPRRGSQIRLLIADDSRLIRETLACLCSLIPRLKIIGQAANGLEAIAAIRKLKPDVVTLDIRMPRMSGIEVLKAIKAEQIDCMVIILSVMTQEICLKKYLELGANHVFDKATEFEKALEVLRKL